MHPLCTPSQLEEKIVKQSSELFWLRFWAVHNDSAKQRRWTQLMRSINQKKESHRYCDFSHIHNFYTIHVNKLVIKRAILNRLK